MKRRKNLIIITLGLCLFAVFMLRGYKLWLEAPERELLLDKYGAILTQQEIDNRIYTLEKQDGKLFVREYDLFLHRIWSYELQENINKACCGVVISFDGSPPVYARISDPSDKHYVIWLSIYKHRLIIQQRLLIKSTSMYGFSQILSLSGSIYVLGGTCEDNVLIYPTIIKLDMPGIVAWKWRSISVGISGPGITDKDGKIIYTIHGGHETLISKYSLEGKKLWTQGVRSQGFNRFVWVKTNKQNNIYTIVLMNEGIAGDSGSDATGRDQDYLLKVYGPNGKVLRTTRLSHGWWLHVVDAVIDQSGGIIALGNRQRIDRAGYPQDNSGAQLIKCNSRGKIVWSRGIRVPAGFHAANIQIDGRGGIYVLGYKLDNAGNQESSFIYKFKDRL